MNVYHKQVGLAYCIQTLLLYRAKMGLSITTFSNSRSFRLPRPKSGNNGLIPKNYFLIE